MTRQLGKRNQIRGSKRREQEKWLRVGARSEARRKTEREDQNGLQNRGIHGGVERPSERDEKRARNEGSRTKKAKVQRCKRATQGM